MESVESKIENKLKEIFELQGIYINENDYREKIELDSLQLVNIILDIENEFLIQIEGNLSNYALLSSFDDFKKFIMESIR